jgi:hypothetical protein
MTEFLLDECYSCVIASLVLIKSMTVSQNGETSNVIEAAVDLSQSCIACIRSHEAGSVLPETLDHLADECDRLLALLAVASMESPESTACSSACEKFIHTYHQVV